MMIGGIVLVQSGKGLFMRMNMTTINDISFINWCSELSDFFISYPFSYGYTTMVLK